jgi:hypothetical protein
MKLWQVNSGLLKEIPTKNLDKEERLQSWIADDLSLLGLDALLIGREVQTSYGGRIDILALSRSGDLIVVEAKRNQTPREVVAQALDYASWAQEQSASDIYELYAKYQKKDLAIAFSERFDQSIPETLNSSHEIYIVAGSLDPSSRRIVEYLSEVGGLTINTAFFRTFIVNGVELLGSDWLLDQEQVVERAKKQKRGPWTGYWFVNAGPDPNVNWEDNRKFGYLGAGGGIKYSRPLFNLPSGGKVFVYRKTEAHRGYVGYGEVTGEPRLPADATLGGKPFLELGIDDLCFRKNAGDPDLANYVVPIRWFKTIPESDALRFPNIFANQNIVCRIYDAATTEFLEKNFA